MPKYCTTLDCFFGGVSKLFSVSWKKIVSQNKKKSGRLPETFAAWRQSTRSLKPFFFLPFSTPPNVVLLPFYGGGNLGILYLYPRRGKAITHFSLPVSRLVRRSPVGKPYHEFNKTPPRKRGEQEILHTLDECVQGSNTRRGYPDRHWKFFFFFLVKYLFKIGPGKRSRWRIPCGSHPLLTWPRLTCYQGVWFSWITGSLLYHVNI